MMCHCYHELYGPHRCDHVAKGKIYLTADGIDVCKTCMKAMMNNRRERRSGRN